MFKCFIGEVRDGAQDEVLHLRRLLDREVKDRKEAVELLSQERAKCALLEQEISNAVQAAREMGESLRMYFSQSGSDASSDGRLRAMCEATIPEALPACTSATNSSSQQAGIHCPDLQHQMMDAYPQQDQSATSVEFLNSSSRSKKRGSHKGHHHRGRQQYVPHQPHDVMQHRLRASCTSSSVNLSTADSAEFSPLLSSQSRLGAGSKRMQRHVLQVADQLQNLAMSWKQRLDNCQPRLDSTADPALEQNVAAAVAPTSARTLRTYNPVFAESQAATGVDGRKSRLHPSAVPSPASVTGNAKSSDMASSAGPQPAVRGSFSISDSSSTAVPRPPVVQATQSALRHADSFPTPPMSVVQSNSLQNSAGNTTDTSGHLRASVASAATEEWSSRSSGTTIGAQGRANNISSSVGSRQGIGRYRGSWHKPVVNETVTEECEVDAELADLHHACDQDDKVESGSPVTGAAAKAGLTGDSDEDSELSDPEQFPDVEYSTTVERRDTWPLHIQPTQVSPPVPACTHGSYVSARTPGCTITRGAVTSKASPALQPIRHTSNQPVMRASPYGGGPAPAAWAAAITPKGLNHHLPQQQQQQEQVECLPRELRSMAPLKRHQQYLNSSQLSFGSLRVKDSDMCTA